MMGGLLARPPTPCRGGAFPGGRAVARRSIGRTARFPREFRHDDQVDSISRPDLALSPGANLNTSAARSCGF